MIECVVYSGFLCGPPELDSIDSISFANKFHRRSDPRSKFGSNTSQASGALLTAVHCMCVKTSNLFQCWSEGVVTMWPMYYQSAQTL